MGQSAKLGSMQRIDAAFPRLKVDIWTLHVQFVPERGTGPFMTDASIMPLEGSDLHVNLK